ncbi:MAG: DNA mismatch repair endonuclease MutL [Candidatus Alcyoniella australis]|nr:DNA mismatch repair endonuclease MutL [Candidatus Alcyoniella australis]
MNRIKLLDDGTINRIAAGEVVERPASVVKELVENSLDAGATEIVVEIERAGRRLIRVADNGCGMGYDDCLLAVERHATSKINDESDLLAVRTLGFRGEALPSIAAVSRFALTSCGPQDEGGTKLTINGGVIQSVEQVGCPAGTMVEVRELFYNTPARRRFLAGLQTELGHIIDRLTRIALARPEVRFVLRHNGRNVFVLPALDDALLRVSSLIGDDVSRALIRLELDQDEVMIRGGIAAPEVSRGSARQIYALVNGRAVRDKVTTGAVIEGFRDHLMRGRYPVAVIDLNTALDMVDVNVHPAKTEVRFRDSRSVFQALSQSVRQALRSHAESSMPQPTGQGGGSEQVLPDQREQRVADAVARYSVGRGSDAGAQPYFPRQEQPELIQRHDERRPWRIIGQVLDCYILAQDEQGLVIIDQHAAHERVVYERLLGQIEQGAAQSQRLLLPITLDLAGTEGAALEQFAPELEGFGITVERFGPQTFVIKSLPALVPESAASNLVRDLVSDLAEIGSAGRIEDARDQVVERIACHGAIRAGTELSEAAMRRLLDELLRTRNPEHCPHGRPTVRRVSSVELERMFKRT